MPIQEIKAGDNLEDALKNILNSNFTIKITREGTSREINLTVDDNRVITKIEFS